MRLALFSSTIDVKNGYGNITYEYCMELYKKNIDFTLFLPKTEEKIVDSFKEAPIPFKIEYKLPKYIFRIKLWNFLSYFGDIDLSSFDIVHSLFAFPYCFIACRLAKKYKKPFLMGAQGTYGVLPLTYPIERFFLKCSYKNAREIIVRSQFTKEKIEELAKEKYSITIIHNGVNFERFQKEVNIEDLKERYRGKKILMTVGGLKSRKGQDLVIEALPEIIKKVPNVVYILVGGGSLKEKYQELAGQSNVSDHVVFVGNQSDDDLIKYYKVCDVYIHTPKVVNFNFEGFGIVYLEASACKKPIIASDAGGIRDAVLENKTGLVVADCDKKGIIEGAIKLLENDELCLSLGNAGYEYAKEHDWPIITNKFIEIYKKYE